MVFNAAISSALRAIGKVSHSNAEDETVWLTRSVDAMRTLLLRTISNGRPKSDDRWLILLLASLSDCVVDAGEITINASV